MPPSTSLVSFGFALLCAVVVVAQPQDVGAALRSFELTPADTFFACASKARGRLVTGSPSAWLLAMRSEQPCPKSTPELLEALGKLGAVLKETPDADYVVPKSHLMSDGFSVRFPWSTLRSVVISKAVETADDSVGLTSAQVQKIGTAARQQMRPTPGTANAPDGASTGVLSYETVVDVRRLSGSSVTHVIAISGVNTEYGRLGVGVLDGEDVRFLWDSPLFGSWMMRLAYADLDGDGRMEILIGVSVGMRGTTLLHAFTADGDEISRQPGNCNYGGAAPLRGVACGIGGDSVEIVNGVGKAKDLLVSPVAGEPVRFVLTDGRYRAK